MDFLKRRAVAVMLGGACGAVGRILTDSLFSLILPASFSIGILFANVTGSFCMGLLSAAIARRRIGPLSSAFLGTGFLGGYTTFSTYALQNVLLMADGKAALVLCHMMFCPVAGIAAAWAGWTCAGKDGGARK